MKTKIKLLDDAALSVAVGGVQASSPWQTAVKALQAIGVGVIKGDNKLILQGLSVLGNLLFGGGGGK